MTKAVVLLGLIFAMAIKPMQCMQISESNEVEQTFGEVSDFQRMDIIVKKIRLNNGIWQYRRWNETQGCWLALLMPLALMSSIEHLHVSANECGAEERSTVAEVEISLPQEYGFEGDFVIADMENNVPVRDNIKFEQKIISRESA